MAKFSLKLKQEEVEIEQLDGSTKTYVVKELDGRTMEGYLNASKKNVIMTDGKVSGMRTFDDMYVNLLEAALYDADGERILAPEIRLWPSSLQKSLFDIAQRLSGLSGEAEDKEGND